MPENFDYGALPEKVRQQIEKAALPTSGAVPFEPRLVTKAGGKVLIDTAEIKFGPKAGKVGRCDTQGRIWIRDRAHAVAPDHWDVQIDKGKSYFRVDDAGNLLE